MIDYKLIVYTNRILLPVAELLKNNKIKSTQITILGFLFGILCFSSIVYHNFALALLFLLINRFCDGLDGVLARITKTSNTGAYLDVTFDFIFYSSIPLAFGIIDEKNLLSALVLEFGIFIACSSFLVSAIFAEKIKIENQYYKKKGFFYTVGLAEGFETICIYTLMLLMPLYFNIFAYFFALLCIITGILRFIQNINILK